jgi:tetratricopeptide (TPR) repeat protein
MGIKDEALSLFREALEAENARDLETAKRKLDEIMELTREREPELYFEACFRMADVFLQEDNYRGAVKCAVRGICRAPSEELRRLGIRRLWDILTILKSEGHLGDLAENMEPTLGLVKEDEELHSFVLALVKLASGEEVETEGLPPEFREILEGLKE